MRARRRGMALAAALVGVALVPSSAVASTAVLDAKRLALSEFDFPTSVQRMSQRESRVAPLPGGTGQAYTTTFQFQAARRTKAVGTIVITASSAAVARSVYAAAVADARRSAVATLRVPALGDQQYAALYGRPALDDASAIVWVRKNTAVWQIQVSSVRNPSGFSRAEALAELVTYAVKQKRRVGAG